jgi:hypothetical protein
MVQLLQGRPRTLDQTNRTVRRQIGDQADGIGFADLWRSGRTIISSTGRNPVRIDNQGLGFDVVDNTGHCYGRGQQISAKGGNATYAVICLADSLQIPRDPHHADTVTAAVQNAVRLSASSDPGCVYVVVP